jgi:hypothetical protein
MKNDMFFLAIYTSAQRLVMTSSFAHEKINFQF